MIKAIAYLRTSSAANVGGDSDVRQRLAIDAFAKRSGYEIVDQYYDEAVSGVDPIESRPGFAALLDRIESNGVRTVIVEDASRFARQLMVQELGIVILQQRGVKLLAANGDDLTETDDEMRVAFRQMAGILVQLEKTRLVKKLKGARDRASAAAGKRVEGQKGYEPAAYPALYAAAREIAATMGDASLRAKGAEFSRRGFKTASGADFGPNQVRLILSRI